MQHIVGLQHFIIDWGNVNLVDDECILHRLKCNSINLLTLFFYYCLTFEQDGWRERRHDVQQSHVGLIFVCFFTACIYVSSSNGLKWRLRSLSTRRHGESSHPSSVNDVIFVSFTTHTLNSDWTRVVLISCSTSTTSKLLLSLCIQGAFVTRWLGDLCPGPRSSVGWWMWVRVEGDRADGGGWGGGGGQRAMLATQMVVEEGECVLQGARQLPSLTGSC